MQTGPRERDRLRVHWLSCYPHLWENWDGDNDPRARGIIERMKAAELVAPSTYWKDIRMTRLIALTRIYLGQIPGTLPFNLSSSAKKGSDRSS